MSIMAGGGELTKEDQIIYTPEISKLIDEAEDKIIDNRHVGSLRMTLETLVFRAICEWTGE